jgi:hypothetical protein
MKKKFYFFIAILSSMVIYNQTAIPFEMSESYLSRLVFQNYKVEVTQFGAKGDLVGDQSGYFGNNESQKT